MPLLMLKGSPDDWGLIPSFLSDDDPRPARDQFDARYIAGWRHMPGHTLDDLTYELTYPGDPPLHPVSIMMFRNELLLLYPYDFVVVREPDGTWQICRMD